MLGAFAAKASQAGVDLVVENEGGYWGELPAEMDQLLQAVHSPRVSNLLDPGNHLNQNQHLLTAADVQLLAPRTRFAHIKDARRGRRGYVVVGTGDVPYARIFTTLAASGVEPFVSLETHMGGLFRGRTSARCMGNLIRLLRESGYDLA
jgi:sugar phosphate isomerase/epimerase